jgi:ribosomal protein S18 acetylase RimI-like enzyme
MSFELAELTSKDDILDLYYIYKHCMYKPSPKKYAVKVDEFMRDKSAKVLACKNAGKTVGIMVISFIDVDSAEIVGIATSETFRLRGAGRFMIGAAMERFEMLSLYAETDDDAVGFYRAVGFDIRECTQVYGGESVTRYDCILRIYLQTNTGR